MFTPGKKNINQINFGILSSKDILDMSVCEVINNKMNGSGTVYDPKMGPSLDSYSKCITCNKDAKLCPGHFGHIMLKHPILHPLFLKYIYTYLKCICVSCSRLFLNKDQLILYKLLNLKGEIRIKKISELRGKVDICIHCKAVQRNISLSQDKKFHISYENKQIHMDVFYIENIFRSFPDDDVRLCGFDPHNLHPKHFIIRILPVIPPICRPFAKNGDNICDDDLTYQLLEIVKINKSLETKNISYNVHQKYIQALNFRISTYYNNSQNKARHPTNGRPIKGIKERLTGKSGQLRNNLMGKRVEYSGRTVIGPDPTLPFGWMGMPRKIATNLTIPVRATRFNIGYLESLVNNEKANFIVKNKNNIKINLKYAIYGKQFQLKPNDIIIRNSKRILYINQKLKLLDTDELIRPNLLHPNYIIIRDQKQIIIDESNTETSLKVNDKVMYNDNIVFNFKINQKRYIKLNLGDIVYRHLQDGDTVLLNRQPTLHSGSMLAKRIKIRPTKTFTMNLATTKTFNADFDGDEMNIHVPQSIEAMVELQELSASKHHIISPQSSKPNMTIVQDSLLGVYLMTRDNMKLTREQFFDICMQGLKCLWDPDRIQDIKEVLESKSKCGDIFTSRNIISLLFPRDFIYEKKNDKLVKEPIVRIYRGVLYEGVLDKSTIGSSNYSIIKLLYKEYGSEVCSNFISNIQFVTNKWLLINGFSIGLEDCLIKSPESIIKIKDKLTKCYFEADQVKRNTLQPFIKEVRVVAALNKAKDVGMKIAKESMRSDNNFLSTVYSGSKGDFFNISQLTGLLGQQNLKGGRIAKTLNNGKRTIVHYPLDIKVPDVVYESRGFIKNSFINGLNPREFFFHTMSGREGVIDTAMGTATTGYIQRRIIKICEDIQICYDNTVRDNNNNIYQYCYGEMNLDPRNISKVNDENQICNVSRIANKLNLNHELTVKKTLKPRKWYLRELSKKTGKRLLYKNLTIEELDTKLSHL